MNRQDMIDKIYEVIADKTLSLGCIIGLYRFRKKPHRFVKRIPEIYPNGIKMKYTELGCPGEESIIIGHPVMIGDVLDRWENNCPTQCDGYCGVPDIDDVSCDIVVKWEEPRKPIDDQSDECIEYVYSLIKSD